MQLGKWQNASFSYFLILFISKFQIMKKIFFTLIAAAVLLTGMTGCSKEDEPSPTDISVLEQSLVGLWWDEYEYAGTTETGVPFSRVLLAVKANADHTGCLYLGAFDGKSYYPLAVYGGPKDAGFTWKLLADGSVLLHDPASGESIKYARTRADEGGSYGDSMTDVASTNVTYAGSNMTVTNGDYSGTLTKANAEQQANIEKKLSVLIPATNLSDEDQIGINNEPGSNWGR